MGMHLFLLNRILYNSLHCYYTMATKKVRVKPEGWSVVEVLMQEFRLSYNAADRLVDMIEKEDCTVPFIARYRKEVTNGMEADKLREFVDALLELRDVQKKAATMIKNVEKQGKLDEKIEHALSRAHTKEELNHLFAPYKGDKKHSLADRARAIGLDKAVDHVMRSPYKQINLDNWVDKSVKGRTTSSEVHNGMKYLLSELIAKDPNTLDEMKKIFDKQVMFLESTQHIPVKKKSEETQENKQSKTVANNNNNPVQSKYVIYFNFKCRVTSLQSYQVLAMNRGEAQKELTVKVVCPDRTEQQFISWCKRHWIKHGFQEDVEKLITECINYAHTRFIKPLVCRTIRSELTRKAHLDSVQVFSRNLGKLLLTAPVRGKVVLGVDPGFWHGCKCAVVSANGDVVLDTAVVNLNYPDSMMSQLMKMYKTHKFQVIAIGNGTACRETEQCIARFIYNTRNADLLYCVVNEQGASIYSVTDEAKRELPGLEPNLRSAVSIARRLQDPLVELVKIDPKHIGVGMYQHDIPQSLMKAALSNVVEDCVTFVGVDLNVATASLLQHVAGLKANQVKNILEWRRSNGAFINRQQLLKVKGLGEKTFKQCAGFMRIRHSGPYKASVKQEPLVKQEFIKEEIEASSSLGKRKAKSAKAVPTKKVKAELSLEPNPLDQTWIHPESYDITMKFLNMVDCDMTKIGTDGFISKLKRAISRKSVSDFARDLSIGEPTLKLVVEGLTQPKGYRDIREETNEPLYRRGITSVNDLRHGTTLRGRITNVTDFGVFVDIGVGKDGLLHTSDMQGRWYELKEVLGPNDVITVRVKHVHPKVSLSLVQADSIQKTKFV